ncbi:hypothetical protein ACQKKX_02275 [Neorhizobium sp. NPDC001467]|uniref:hypothetical protein n=1 Tax=Neorhizobium sp. NPDC001467 TaxID=3390595 RepID=UPI003D090780
MSEYHVNGGDADSVIRNLNDLLDVICDLQFNTQEVDRRVDSLLWIARDMSQGIVRCFNDEAKVTLREVRA